MLLILLISYIISHHIIDVKRQNHLKVGTDKPKLKVNMESVSDDDVRKKTSWKATFWAGSESCIQTGNLLHPPAGRFRSLGQQPGKHGYRRLTAWPVAPEDNGWVENEATVCREDHVLAQVQSRVRRCTSVKNSAQVCCSVKSMKLIINSKLVARLFQDHVQYLFHSSNYRGSTGSAFTEFRDFAQT